MLHQHFDKLEHDAAQQKDKHREEAEVSVTPNHVLRSEPTEREWDKEGDA